MQIPRPFRIDAGDVPRVGWDDPARGTIAWQTLLSGDTTPTGDIVCGIAHLRTGDTFAMHHHAQAEVYFGLSGHVTVMIDGSPHALSPDVALFIPPNAVHGIVQATEPVRFFYTFAANSFADITYHFAP
jgi:mannose-6-phosphate isomerase-like protein (cupin superfamily)